MKGDPGKVATRVTNFIASNPTAAAKLFTPEQLSKMEAWARTNKRLVPDPAATNPPKSGYGPTAAITKAAAKGATGQSSLIGTVLGSTFGSAGAAIGAGIGGVVGGAREAVGAAKSIADVKKALREADRSSMAETIVKGGRGGLRRETPGLTQAAQTMTVNAPGDPHDGEQVKIIERLPNGRYLARTRDGKVINFGDRSLR
jgi:hypothetical protein